MKPLVPPPIIAATLIGAMYVLAARLDVFAFDFPGRTTLAAALFVAGFFIDAVSVAAFLRARTTVNPLAPSRSAKLVTEGLYRFSRNPMYAGMLLMLIAAFLYFGEGLNAAIVALFVVILNEAQIKPEENALEEKFGDDYRAYKTRVRRWI
ncbi:MAG: isoprenylcysteine carboxylmethyltransferase family protein [Parvularculaceae bacterium]